MLRIKQQVWFDLNLNLVVGISSQRRKECLIHHLHPNPSTSHWSSQLLWLNKLNDAWKKKKKKTWRDVVGGISSFHWLLVLKWSAPWQHTPETTSRSLALYQINPGDISFFFSSSFNAIRATWKGGNEIMGHISKTRGMEEHFHWYGGLRRNEYIMRSWDFSHVNSPRGVQEQNHPSDYPPHLLCSSFLHCTVFLHRLYPGIPPSPHPSILPSSSHLVWIQRGPLHLQICRNLIIHDQFQCRTGSWSAGFHVRVKTIWSSEVNLWFYLDWAKGNRVTRSH